MWKESYKIGIDRIDQQHKELFLMVDKLVKAIENDSDKEEYKKVIQFLKNYVVYHFKDEENYQKLIHFPGAEEHKAIHTDFTLTVLDFEQKLEETDYDIKVVKNLAGLLTTWLIYHVADSDQKMGSNESKPVLRYDGSFDDFLKESVCDVLQKMAELSVNTTEEENTLEYESTGNIFVEIPLSGDQAGHVLFSFSEQFGVQLMNSMAFSSIENIDDMILSMLGELANICTANAVTRLFKKGTRCILHPPIIQSSPIHSSSSQKIFIFETDLGSMIVSQELRDSVPKTLQGFHP